MKIAMLFIPEHNSIIKVTLIYKNAAFGTNAMYLGNPGSTKCETMRKDILEIRCQYSVLECAFFPGVYFMRLKYWEKVNFL